MRPQSWRESRARRHTPFSPTATLLVVGGKKDRPQNEPVFFAAHKQPSGVVRDRRGGGGGATAAAVRRSSSSSWRGGQRGVVADGASQTAGANLRLGPKGIPSRGTPIVAFTEDDSHTRIGLLLCVQEGDVPRQNGSAVRYLVDID